MASLDEGPDAQGDRPGNDPAAGGAAAQDGSPSAAQGSPDTPSTTESKPRARSAGTPRTPRKTAAKPVSSAVEAGSPTTFLPAAGPGDRPSTGTPAAGGTTGMAAAGGPTGMAVGVPGRHRPGGDPAPASAGDPAPSEVANASHRPGGGSLPHRRPGIILADAQASGRPDESAGKATAKEAAAAQRQAEKHAAAAEKARRAEEAERAKADKRTAAEADKAARAEAAEREKAEKHAAAERAKAEKQAAAERAKAEKQAAAERAKAEKQAAAERAKAGKQAAEQAQRDERAAAARAKKEARVAAAEAKKDERTAAKLARREARAGAKEQARQERITRKARRLDLRPSPFTVTSVVDWERPAEALTTLFTRAESAALEAVDWYLRHKRSRKRASRLLRALSILLVSMGVLVPLLTSVVKPLHAEYGYALLALAAACVGFDHFFGLSSGWMRDMVTAQAIQRRLEVLRFDWASECARSALTTRRQLEEVERQLTLLREFAGDLVALTSSETSEWIAEFQTSLAGAQRKAAATASRAAAARRAAAASQEASNRVS
jgi:VIT1/CCC1 family predicted Fe2+/Mn2+ transporter